MRKLTPLFVVAVFFLAGCGGSSESSDEPQPPDDAPAQTTAEEVAEIPEISGEGYEVVDVIPLQESKADFYEGPIEDAGIQAADVDAVLTDDLALQAAYGDTTTTLIDYELLVINFWDGEVGGDLVDVQFFFRTPEAERAYAEEALENLDEALEETT